MTNLELAKEQGSQAAPNVIDAAKAGEVQIDVTLAQEQGNQAAPLIADSLASSESYDAIKQQGNQAMPLIVDALAGGGSDTGFELLDYNSPAGHIPFFIPDEPGVYMLAYGGILRNGYNLPDFTKLSVDNTEYDIYPIPDQEPSTTVCYLAGQDQVPIDSQEVADEIKAVTGIDVKIGDAIVVVNFVLLTEQILSGDVPFTLYAGQDSWSGTLHEYVDTSADVYGGLDINSDSTAYKLLVYTDNASNPYYKIGDDGEWTVYDSSNKPEFYLPGDYTIHLKATNDYDDSEITNEFTFYIRITSKSISTHIVEDPSAMFAGIDIRANIGSSYSSSELDGRNDIVFLYKEQSAANWSSAAMTSTSDGYFAEVEIGWGNHVIDYKIQMNGVTLEETNYFYEAVPMTPSFVDIINDRGTNYAQLRFGANYPDMNTVETIEYRFGIETWTDAVHDSVSGYELAEIHGYGQQTIYFRTKLVSDSSVKSATVEHSFSVLVPDQVVPNACTDIDGNTYDAVILGRQVWLGSNLRATHYSDGTSIQNYKHVNNDANNDSVYGLLYTYEAYTRHFSENADEAISYLGAAPEGWHIPCMNDIYTLSYHVTQNYTNPAKDLASKNNWQSSSTPNAIGNDLSLNNATGFNMQPSGQILSDDTSYGFLSEAILASSYRLTVTYEQNNTVTQQEEMRHLLLRYDLTNWISGAQALISNYFPVRCIYDGTPEEFLASLAQQQSSTDRE